MRFRQRQTAALAFLATGVCPALLVVSTVSCSLNPAPIIQVTADHHVRVLRPAAEVKYLEIRDYSRHHSDWQVLHSGSEVISRIMELLASSQPSEYNGTLTFRGDGSSAAARITFLDGAQAYIAVGTTPPLIHYEDNTRARATLPSVLLECPELESYLHQLAAEITDN